MFVPESAHGVQRHKKHTTYSVPSCFCNVPSRSFKTLCGPFEALANHFGTSTLTVNAAFSLAMMLWPQVRLCYIRC